MDVSEPQYIDKVVYNYFYDKKKKNTTVQFFSYISETPKSITKELLYNTHWYSAICTEIANEMSYAIRNRIVIDQIENTLYPNEKCIRYNHIKDNNSGKDRELGLESVLLRLYEALTSEGCKPLYKAKIGEFQVGSIKKRGQSYAKKHIVRWMSRDTNGTKYGGQGDIRHCYPSIPHDKILGIYHRDLKKCKNGDLLYLIDVIFYFYEKYPSPDCEDCTKGIPIGSPASKDMCNYYMSKLYHYVMENLYIEKKRRGVSKRYNMVDHIIIYADDILIFGSNKKHLHKAMRKIIEFLSKEMGLELKPDWIIFRTGYKDANNITKGRVIDFIGIRFHGCELYKKDYLNNTVTHKKVRVTIRKSSFLRVRKQFRHIKKKILSLKTITIKHARSVACLYGIMKNTNSITVREKENITAIKTLLSIIISDYDKKDKYTPLWYRGKFKEVAYA